MSAGLEEVTVGYSLASIVGNAVEMVAGGATSPNTAAMIRVDLQKAGMSFLNEATTAVEFGMAAIGGGVASPVANAVNEIANGMNKIMGGMTPPQR